MTMVTQRSEWLPTRVLDFAGVGDTANYGWCCLRFVLAGVLGAPITIFILPQEPIGADRLGLIFEAILKGTPLEMRLRQDELHGHIHISVDSLRATWGATWNVR